MYTFYRISINIWSVIPSTILPYMYMFYRISINIWSVVPSTILPYMYIFYPISVKLSGNKLLLLLLIGLMQNRLTLTRIKKNWPRISHCLCAVQDDVQSLGVLGAVMTTLVDSVSFLFGHITGAQVISRAIQTLAQPLAPLIANSHTRLVPLYLHNPI